MDLKNVRIFVDVMKCGSFAAVARRLDIDPSSVSRSISTLEAELGFRLLQRTTRKLAPTEAGSKYFSRVEILVDEFERAGEQAQDLVNQPNGLLRITACTSFGQRIIAPLLPKVRERFPDLTIDLFLSDQQVDIIEEQIDLAIRFGTRPSGDFIASKLVARRHQVCASPAYIDNFGKPLSPGDLEHHSCLLFPVYGSPHVWKFRKSGEPEFGVPVTGQLLVSHGLTMTICTVDGMGPSLLPDWLCQEELADGKLVDLFPEYECTSTDFETAAWLVYPSRAYIPLKLRAFIDFLRAEVTGFV